MVELFYVLGGINAPTADCKRYKNLVIAITVDKNLCAEWRL